MIILNISVTSIRDSLGKAVSKIGDSLHKDKQPDIDIVNALQADHWKISYILVFFLYHSFVRVVSLWIIFTWINNAFSSF